MTRNGQKPQYELWCQHTTNSNNIAGKTFCINAVMMALLLLPPIGVIASSNGNNGSIASIESSVSFPNNSNSNDGTINELVASDTIQFDDNATKHTISTLLSSLSLLTSNDSNNSRNDDDGADDSDIDNNGNVDNVFKPHMSGAPALMMDKVAEGAVLLLEKPQTKTTATITSSSASSASSATKNPNRTTKTASSPMEEEITNAMQTSEFIGSSNTRRHVTSTSSSTHPATTNRPYVSTFAESMLRHKVASHTRQYQSKHHHEHHFSGPFFEGPLNTTTGALQVAVHLHTEGIFNCRVGMLKDKTVMWVRRTADKFSLLTVGNITYSGDPRIKITFQYPNNWRLHINPMLKDDAGLYMCQVSTHPPRVFATNVTVMPPAIRVIDEQGNEIRDRYYKIGSTIDLTCQVATTFITNNASNTPESKFSLLMRQIDAFATTSKTPFAAAENEIDISDRATLRNMHSANDSVFRKIVWTKDGENVSKDALFNLSKSGGWIISRLSILSAERRHSGIYSCSIINSTSTTVDVQILNGETPAAVQHSDANQVNNNMFRRPLQMLASLLIVLYISC